MHNGVRKGMKASVVHGCRLLCVINHHAIRDAPVARSVNSRDPSSAGNLLQSRATPPRSLTVSRAGSVLLIVSQQPLRSTGTDTWEPHFEVIFKGGRCPI
jgi:hypothetical protein